MASHHLALLLGLLHSAATSEMMPVQRHVGRWTGDPKACPTTYQIPGSPLIGNGDVGVTFCGPANHTTFFLASNSFWAPNVDVDGRPSQLNTPKPGMGSPPGGQESYVTQRIGDLSLLVPALSQSSSYAASQDLYNAAVNASFNDSKVDCALEHSSVVAAAENLLITTVAVSGAGCGSATLALGIAGQFHIQNSAPPTGKKLNTPLPSASGVDAGKIPWLTRDSVTTTHNSITAATCYTAGQHNDSQRWHVDTSTALTTKDGRCLTVLQNATVPSAPGAKMTITSNCSGAQPWHLAPAAAAGAYLIKQPATGLCATIDNHLEFVTAVACGGTDDSRSGGGSGMAAEMEQQVWLHDPVEGQLWSKADGAQKFWGKGHCLTAVEPNPLMKAALATRVTSRDDKVVGLDWQCVSANTTGCSRPDRPGCIGNASTALGLSQSEQCTSSPFDLPDGAVFIIATAIVTQGECEGCDADAHGAVDTALTTAKQANTASVLAAHHKWWDSYWRTGAQVDLGPNQTTLEQFYYGCQYLIGSSARPGKNAPALDAAFETSADGDEMFVLNYNFQAPYYSVFSDNRPELAIPTFHTVENFIDLGKWRASMRYWGAGGHPEAPGFWTQDFNHMALLQNNKTLEMINGTRWFKAGFRGINFPTHISPAKHFYFISDWGQKSPASFAVKLFQDYYDFTQNTTFLRNHAYPLAKLNAEFYLSYMTREASFPQACDGGCYNVMHSCAMEGCKAANFPHPGWPSETYAADIEMSNNPPFDLGFVHGTFRFVLENSVVLGVDADLRPQWQHVLDNLSPYPRSVDEYGRSVLAQATGSPSPTSNVTGGFPNAKSCTVYLGGKNASGCYNARYPICYFNGIHPGGDIDLASEESLLKAAQATTEVVNGINGYAPTNSLSMAWAPSARVVNSSTWLLPRLAGGWGRFAQPNGFPQISMGDAIENAGASVAINDLLATVHGHMNMSALVLFAGGWPKGQAVSFRNIRIKGAFTVSAAAVGAGDNATDALPVKLTAPVSITSHAGQNLTLAWWVGAKPPTVTVTRDGGGGSSARSDSIDSDSSSDSGGSDGGRGNSAVVVVAVDCGVRRPCYRFATTQGDTYSIE